MVELKETPGKAGETPEKRGEPELQGIVSLQQIRSKCKGIAEPQEIFVVMRFPVFLLVDLFGPQKTGNTLDFSEVCHVASIFELVLIEEVDLVYRVIEDVETFLLACAVLERISGNIG